MARHPRAQVRAQAAKAKARARRQVQAMGLPEDPVTIGIYANTRTRCSCHLCTAACHHTGPVLQERRQDAALAAQEVDHDAQEG